MCDYKVMRMRARSVGLAPFIYPLSYMVFFSIFSVFVQYFQYFSIYNMMRMRARSVGLAPADNRGVMAAVLRQAIISISALFKNVVA